MTDSCMLSELTGQINELCEEKNRKKLTAAFVNDLLIQNGYLKEEEENGDKVKRVTEKGSDVGIREERRQLKRGGTYYALTHTRESQQMILELLKEYFISKKTPTSKAGDE